MSKFRKKPVVIEAWEVAALLGSTTDALPQPIRDVMGVQIDGVPMFGFGDGVIFVQTLEGTMKAELGDWIIRGVAGEFYPCKPDIFAATYDPVPQEDPE